jgi:hypothetical protein
VSENGDVPTIVRLAMLAENAAKRARTYRLERGAEFDAYARIIESVVIVRRLKKIEDRDIRRLGWVVCMLVQALRYEARERERRASATPPRR